MNWKSRYNAAHLKHTAERTPSVVKNGGIKQTNITVFFVT